METEIGLFAMKRDVIARYLGHFTGGQGRGPPRPDVAAGAGQLRHLRDAQEGRPGRRAQGGGDDGADETPRGKRRCVVVLDIGTDASNLIITDGGKIIWQRPIPLGGNNFTRALTKETEAHLRQGRAPEAERRQEPGPGRRSSRRSSRCSPTSSARCSGRSGTSPTPTATPTSPTWSAWAAPSACRASRSTWPRSSSSRSASRPGSTGWPATRSSTTRSSPRTCSPSRWPTGWPCRASGRPG